MGSLENGFSFSLKKDHHFSRSSSSIHRPRSSISRFFLLKKLDYLLWVSSIVVFLFFIILIQAFLPGFKSGSLVKDHEDMGYGDFVFLKEMGRLDFGDGVRFQPTNVLAKFQKELNLTSSNGFGRKGVRFGLRKPQLALVFPDLSMDPQHILMVTVAESLQEIGYAIQVFSLEDGPVRSVWKRLGVPVTIVQTDENAKIPVDWLNYDGILVNSIEARPVISCLMQTPFKSIPLIWSIDERTLATRLRQYASDGKIELISDWKKPFNRATVVVFPNYALPMIYSTFDGGNYYVIPGSPAEAWEADNFRALDKENLRVKMGYEPNDFIIMTVGSQFFYGGLWLEHALVLKALLPVFDNFPLDDNSAPRLKIIVLSGSSNSNYNLALEAIAQKLRYPRDAVKHGAVDEDANGVLTIADLVIYGSFLEENSFPENLLKAMCFGKPIIAPDLPMMRKYIDDRVSGYLFPKDNLGVLTKITLELISEGKLSTVAHNVASLGKTISKNLMANEAVEGYALLLENILKYPSEVSPPKSAKEIPSKLKEEWRWNLFEEFVDSPHVNLTSKSNRFLDEVEQWGNRTQVSDSPVLEDTFAYNIWQEEKRIAMANARKRRLDEELRDRTDQPHGTWEEVYRNAKKADRAKNDLHERDEGELERTGQPLCIYEPFHGEGTWPFLHRTSLYRGIGLTTKGRRPGMDDIDAPSRLVVLNNPYYRDALGEVGAFFSIANRIDRLHKNAWIGFQSWRATARNASLTKIAENVLLEDIEKRKHGDALYFWVRMDKDPRSSLQNDFWSFCDSINAGNCRFAFSEALKKMYGIKHGKDSLPPMPVDRDTWSVMHSWALPTRSFLEFVMFSRMFVDALDSQMYDAHYTTGHCYLSLTKDKHCYSRVLELLVNVWAYHSARHMVYVDPTTGAMQEQHKLSSRRGQLRIKWFSYATLKNMDEDLAEEVDLDHPSRRWLWPSTGEVFWQGMLEREKNLRHRQKEKRRQQSKEKISRIRKRTRQKTIGKYVKPPPEEEIPNSTLV